ncbi:alpha-amylase family glycosyl hydrolase, partial [Arthrospira platensis SPKY1]|nr:alpha-amylase family glycosyl hydrolase [Arthrospira platensis SPKY1]
DWHGGDIAGIIEMLEEGYFQKLGVNCIYLSPVVKNPEGKFGFYNKGGVQSRFSAYHGYWPLSFTSIDQRFGTSEELKRLVNLAHRKKKNVLLDIVANHVHEQHPVYLT